MSPSTWSWLVPLPVLLPLLGAALTLMASRSPAVQRAVSTVALTAVVAVAVALVVLTDRHGTQVLWIGAWQEPLGIALVADRLSALMLLVSTVVTLGVLVYSIGQGMTGDERDTPLTIYHPTFLVLAAGVSNAFLAGDLFNLFVSFEMLLFASYVLLTLGGTGSRIRAGTIYVVVNVVSSALFLICLAAVYAATGSLNLAQLAGRLDALDPSVSLVLQLLLLTTFSIKAAVFPLSFWLPDSYPTAPAPVTAVFAGLLTKVGIYAIIRTQTLLFPDSPLTDLLLVASLLTLVIGILGAVAQSDIKRMLSFTLVSHIGYMVFGIAVGTVAGYTGAIFYVAHHITIQTALFLVLGLVERRGGSTSLLKLGGLARLAPLLGVLFFVPAMNLAGIPPMSGFLGKVALTEAGLRLGGTLPLVVVAAGMLTSLLTLYAVAKAWNLAFWRTPAEAHEEARELSLAMGRADADLGDRAYSQALVTHRDHLHIGGTTVPQRDQDEARSIVDEDDETSQSLYQLSEAHALPERLPRTMVGATAVLIALSLALTVVAGPVMGFTGRAARDVLVREGYVSAVLPDGVR
jgi:multicomponent Na+:H+ antiporter subunit D|nr:Na+/H+ antiporter subunit D [uncultured Nocardioides sp.]